MTTEEVKRFNSSGEEEFPHCLNPVANSHRLAHNAERGATTDLVTAGLDALGTVGALTSLSKARPPCWSGCSIQVVRVPA